MASSQFPEALGWPKRFARWQPGHLTALAVPLLAVVTMHAPASQLGLLGVSETAPILLLGLLAGVWVDRFPRRPLLIGADLGRALLLLLIPLAAWLGLLHMVLLYAIAFGVRQMMTPEQLQGRMNASMRFIAIGAMPVGTLPGGMLGQAIGLWPMLVVGAVGRVLPVLWVWFSPIRQAADQWLAQGSAQPPG